MAAESDSEVPELEGVDEKTISKSELKARKAMAKLGLRVVPDVSRVVIRRANNSLFVISPADVFKTANGDSKAFINCDNYFIHLFLQAHIVFGNANIEQAMSQQEAAAKLMGVDPSAVPEEGSSADVAPAAPVDDDDEEVDEDGIDPNDIEMVMSQANVSRSKAVKALRANNNDIVNSIMVF